MAARAAEAAEGEGWVRGVEGSGATGRGGERGGPLGIGWQPGNGQMGPSMVVIGGWKTT